MRVLGVGEVVVVMLSKKRGELYASEAKGRNANIGLSVIGMRFLSWLIRDRLLVVLNDVWSVLLLLMMLRNLLPLLLLLSLLRLLLLFDLLFLCRTQYLDYESKELIKEAHAEFPYCSGK